MSPKEQETATKPLNLKRDRMLEKNVSPRVGTVMTVIVSVLLSTVAVLGILRYFPYVVSTTALVNGTGATEVHSILSYEDETEAVIETVKKVRPAVVSVIVEKDLSEAFELNRQQFQFLPELFEQFDIDGYLDEQDLPSGPQRVGAGTGFIVSSDGLILTNRHVVSDENADYKVFLEDGRSYDAIVVDRDEINDLAVIQIEATDLPTVQLGDSDDLEIGQTVIAIGNSLSEYENSVTKGIVSGVGRSIIASDGRGVVASRLEGVIQTDAAINPGNSGGPLIDLAGTVIGINTAIDRTGQSVGFAIPVNDAKIVIDTVKEFGKIVRPQLGVRYVLINNAVKEINDLTVDYGAIVVRGESRDELAVIPGSAADRAGIVENDIILEVNGTPISERNSLVKLIQQSAPGDTVELTILHDGEEVTRSVTLGTLE